MKIELAVSCHQFQHRFCWMLSSLLQQEGDLPEFVVNAAYIEGTGDPCTQEVLYFFENEDMEVKHTPYPDKTEFQYRGLVRNRQLAESDADWIWFADCDMCVHPEFLAKLKALLEGDSREETRMLYTGRYSTEKPPDSTNALINELEYPCYVFDAYDRACALPKKEMKNIGAGFCQIISVPVMREQHGGVYVLPEENLDYSWDRFSKCKSDAQFRRKVGKVKADLPWFVHLQHERDNEHGEHIELQR